MKIIIENQSKYYPFLKDKAPSFPDGKTEEYKIVSLLKFKMPYYIGPYLSLITMLGMIKEIITGYNLKEKIIKEILILGILAKL